jgi:predicted nucleic acid-binding protein
VKALFVDTAGWMALADASDPTHEATLRARDSHIEQGGLLVSSDFVLDETLTLIRVRLGLSAAARWWDQVESTSLLRWERIDAERAERARRWFFRWTDKEFSFTDCTSFVVMRELGILLALTSDRHFAHAGFEVRP